MSLIMRYIAKFKLLFLGNNKKKNKQALLSNSLKDKNKPQLAINDDGSIHYFGINDANPISDEHVNYRKNNNAHTHRPDIKKTDDAAAFLITAMADSYVYGKENIAGDSYNTATGRGSSIPRADYDSSERLSYNHDENKLFGSNNVNTEHCSSSSSSSANSHSTGGYGGGSHVSSVDSSSSSSSDGGGGCD